MTANGTSATEISPIDIDEMGKNAEKACQFLKALSNQHRLLVLCLLLAGELSVGELEKCVHLSQSALSQHLAILRREGLVKTRRESQTIYYRLHSPEAVRVIALLHDLFCETSNKDNPS